MAVEMYQLSGVAVATRSHLTLGSLVVKSVVSWLKSDSPQTDIYPVVAGFLLAGNEVLWF